MVFNYLLGSVVYDKNRKWEKITLIENRVGHCLRSVCSSDIDVNEQENDATYVKWI